MNLYRIAAHKNEEAARTLVDVKIRSWLEATKDTRKASEDALEALNRHKAEHGC
jgi:hypothetical protein